MKVHEYCRLVDERIEEELGVREPALLPQIRLKLESNPMLCLWFAGQKTNLKHLDGLQVDVVEEAIKLQKWRRQQEQASSTPVSSMAGARPSSANAASSSSSSSSSGASKRKTRGHVAKKKAEKAAKAEKAEKAENAKGTKQKKRKRKHSEPETLD